MASCFGVVNLHSHEGRGDLDGLHKAQQSSFGSFWAVAWVLSFPIGELWGDDLGSLRLLTVTHQGKEVACHQGVVGRFLPCGKHLTDVVRPSFPVAV